MRSEPKAGGPTCPAGLSFAPVGLDVRRLEEDFEEGSIEMSSADPSVHAPKRKARRVAAAGAAAGVVVLLVAAFGRAGHRRAEPPSSASTVGPDDSSKEEAASATPPGAVPPEANAAPAAVTAPTTGTVRLRRPASPNHVWLDGAKLTGASSVVSCGTHQIKVGARSRPRAIEVPCGAQIEIAR